ncbi:MAG: hypothetical protein WC408_01650 [Candidatus Micrarchaeia archaeon]
MELDERTANICMGVIFLAGIALIAYSIFFGNSSQVPTAGTITTRTSSSTASASADGMPSDFTPPSDMAGGPMGMPPG